MIPSMRKRVVTAAILASMAVFLALPAFCDVWEYKAGLWEETVASTSGPAPPPRKFCVASDTVLLVIFPDPDLYEFETCRETILSQSQDEREVEEVCGAPALRNRPLRPVRERHHLARQGAAMTMDRREMQTGLPGLSQTRTERWLGDDCGDVPAK
jgi:hypothetical protein